MRRMCRLMQIAVRRLLATTAATTGSVNGIQITDDIVGGAYCAVKITWVYVQAKSDLIKCNNIYRSTAVFNLTYQWLIHILYKISSIILG